MGFSRQDYWSELSCPSVGDLPNPGIEPRSPTLQADSLPFELPRKLKFKITLLLIPKTLIFFSEQKQLSLQFFNFLTREKPTLSHSLCSHSLGVLPISSLTALVPTGSASPSSSVSHFQNTFRKTINQWFPEPQDAILSQVSNLYLLNEKNNDNIRILKIKCIQFFKNLKLFPFLFFNVSNILSLVKW